MDETTSMDEANAGQSADPQTPEATPEAPVGQNPGEQAAADPEAPSTPVAAPSEASASPSAESQPQDVASASAQEQPVEQEATPAEQVVPQMEPLVATSESNLAEQPVEPVVLAPEKFAPEEEVLAADEEAEPPAPAEVSGPPNSDELAAWSRLGASVSFDRENPVHLSWLDNYRKGEVMGAQVGDAFYHVELGHVCECTQFTDALAAYDSVTGEVHWLDADGQPK